MNENGYADDFSQPEDSAGKSKIPVVSAAKKDGDTKKMKYVIIAAVAIVVVAIIVIAAVVSRSKNKKEDTAAEPVTESVAGESEDEAESNGDTSPVKYSDDFSVSFEGLPNDLGDEFEAHDFETSVTTAIKAASTTFVSADKTTKAPSTEKTVESTKKYLESTTVKTTEPANKSSSVTDVIKSFFDGTYYVDGTMIQGTEQTVMEIAMRGPDYEVFTTMEGMDIAIMSLGGKTYLLNPETKKYMELNAAVKKMFGLDDDSFNFEFSKVKFDSSKPNSVTKAFYNGKEGVCYSYSDGDTTIEFIVVDDEIKQMTLFDKTDDAKNVMQADEFTAKIPGDMITLQGYSKTNMVSFFNSLM